MNTQIWKHQWKWVEEIWPNQEYGWKDGIYEPRKPVYRETETDSSRYLEGREEGMEIRSRVFTETEETGFGIYCYEDTAGLYIPCETKNAVITAVFVNPTEEPYEAYIRAGKILKADHIRVMPGEEKEVSFMVCPIKEWVFVKFCVHSDAVLESQAVMKSLYLKKVDLEYAEKKEKRTKPVIYLASDSTVQTYEPIFYPQTGWGEVFCRFFGTLTEERPCDSCSYPQARTYETDRVIVENRSIGGRSSRSFYEEGKWDEILEQICLGDYVFIQWGHNDNTAVRPNRYVPAAAFEPWLRLYVDGTRQRGGICVLVTPVARYHFEKKADGSVRFLSDFEGYRQVMIKVAEEENLPLIDLTKRSLALCDRAGEEGAAAFFLRLEPGETDGHYRDGVTDSTHLQRYGALKFAQCVAQGILDSGQEALKRLQSFVVLDETTRVPDQEIRKAKRETSLVPTQFTYSELQAAAGQATFLITFAGVDGAVGYRLYEKTEVGDRLIKRIGEQEKESLDARAMAVPSGKTYTYYMTAVFPDGTESKKSREISIEA